MRAKSVLMGKDNEVIPILLDIHCNVNDPKILDCTYNTGKMWKGLSYKPHRMDINPELELDTVGDFSKMPFGDKEFDVIVFDPPHLPTNAASHNSSKIWEKSYGITAEGAGREGDNVVGMFDPFLAEAKRVLKEDGIVLAKIADLVHNHRYQWQQVEFINSVVKAGMTACDMMIKCDPAAGNLQSSKWQNVKHLRKAHCYWIVVRNSSRCECRKKKKPFEGIDDIDEETQSKLVCMRGGCSCHFAPPCSNCSDPITEIEAEQLGLIPESDTQNDSSV